MIRDGTQHALRESQPDGAEGYAPASLKPGGAPTPPRPGPPAVARDETPAASFVRGWRVRLALAAVAVALVVGLAARARVLRAAAVARLTGSVGASASLARTAVTNWLAEREHDAGIAARIAADGLAAIGDPSMTVAERDRARTVLDRTLTTLQRGGGFTAIWVVNDRGRVVAASDGSGPLPPDWASGALSGRAGTRPRIIGPRRHPDGRIRLVFVATLPDGRGAAPRSGDGFVLLELDPRERLFPLVTDFPVASRTAQSMLLMRDGRDIVVLTPLLFPRTGAMSLRLPWESAPASFRQALEGRQGWLFTPDHRGVRTLAVTRRVDRTGWGIARHMDEAEALGADYWRPLLLESLLALVVTGLIAIMVLSYRRAVRLARVGTQLARAELHALEAQLQPHFLFNTLNTISELVHTEAAKADRMIARLGDLLRRTIDRTGDAEEPLREELAFVAAYLEIERARFCDDLEVEWDIAADALDALVPRLLLQPLVENAIRHGIAPAPSGGSIGITARRAGRTLELRLWNTGSVDAPPGAWTERVGLGNTRARLRQMYGADHRFDVRQRPGGGVLVVIALPFRIRMPASTGVRPDSSADRRALSR